MIYYYFGSKEGLYIAVLEDLYRRFNEAESRLALDLAQPDEALTEVIRFVWNYYRRNPEFITLLNTENLHRGRHIAKSPRAGEYSSPAVRVLGDVLERGRHSLEERDRPLGGEHGVLLGDLLDLGDGLLDSRDGGLRFPAERMPAEARLELPLV